MPEMNKMQRDQATILAIIKYVLITALVIGVVLLSFKLFYLLLPFLAGLVLARTSIAVANRIHPPRNPFKKQSGANPVKEATDIEIGAPVALLNVKWAITVYTFLVIGLIALLAGVIFASITQLRELAAYIPQFFSSVNLSTALIAPLKGLESLLGGFVPIDAIAMIEQALIDWQNGLVDAIPSMASAMLNSVGIFVGNLPAIFLAIIVILLSGYYFITDSANLYRFLDRSLNNKKFLAKSINLFNILSKTLLRVIGGYMLLLIITFVMALIGLLIIKMPYAVIFALVAAIIDFLPVLGISATMIPIAIYMVLNGQLWAGIGAIITLVVITLVRRFIEPPILGNALRLHPMATLFSMIVGVAFYGFSGILIGPVIMVIAKEIFSEFGFDQRLRQMTGNLLNKLFD
ncbi:MAG: AI-2E family transporter [Eubacteriales bacterium]|nr:AI-2E family transporter [Eubacteriales bacterium]